MFAVAPAELPWGARLRRAAGPTCEHLWCSASARCVPPGSCFQGAHGLGRWLPTLLGGVPKRSSWPRRPCMGRPRATFSGRHKSSPMQFLAARADWSQAPPGFDHLLEDQLVSAVGHPLASPQGPAANSSSTLAWLASPWCPVPGPHSGTPVGGERQHVRERSPPRGQGPMQVDTRVFCPVPTCPCADPLRARGWRSVHTMQTHIDAHMAGSISGDVPAAWLAQHNRQRCAVCGLSVACRFGIHPTCRPEARAAMAGHMQDTEPGTHSLPSILEIHGSNTPTLRRVPRAARHSWSKALTRALALAHHHNTEAAWKQLLMLPQAVLDAPPRGGKKHHKALAAYTLDRLARWHEGERMALWTSRHSPPKPRRQSRTSQQRRELATGLAREGWDGKACAALLAEHNSHISNHQIPNRCRSVLTSHLRRLQPPSAASRPAHRQGPPASGPNIFWMQARLETQTASSTPSPAAGAWSCPCKRGSWFSRCRPCRGAQA